MTFQIEITPIAEAQIEKAYCWYGERNPEFVDRCKILNNELIKFNQKPN